MRQRRLQSILTMGLLLLACAASPAMLRADDTERGSSGTAEGSDFTRALESLAAEGQGKTPPPALPKGIPVPVPGPSYIITDEMRAELGRAVCAEYIARFEHNRRVFEWQFQSSRIIFWVVILLVAIGIIFSGLQFYKALLVAQPMTEAERREALTELELSARGLKISSPVLGVIILVISLAFFYLFLVHVYRIELVRDASLTTSGGGDQVE